MKKITALSQQKRAKDRINVYLDGEFAFGMAAAAAPDLAVGRTLSEAEIEALQQRDLFEKGKQRAFNLIATRPRSVKEVRRNLLGKGFSELVVGEIVDYLASIELLDDEAFAAYWVDQRQSFRPRSRIALRYELQEKGIDSGIIDKALADLDERESAHRVAAKNLYRWRQLGEEQFKLKLGQYLRRLGYDYEIIKQVTMELWRNVSTGEESDVDAAYGEGD